MFVESWFLLSEAASEKMILHGAFIPYTDTAYNPLEWCIHPHFSYIWWFSCCRYMLPVPYILWAPCCMLLPKFPKCRPFLKSQKVVFNRRIHLVKLYRPHTTRAWIETLKLQESIQRLQDECRQLQVRLVSEGVFGNKDHWHQLRCDCSWKNIIWYISYLQRSHNLTFTFKCGFITNSLTGAKFDKWLRYDPESLVVGRKQFGSVLDVKSVSMNMEGFDTM